MFGWKLVQVLQLWLGRRDLPREQRSFKATAAGKSLGWEAQRRRDGWLRYVGRKKETCDLQ